MKALLITETSALESIDIENDLSVLQALVGGFIQVLYRTPWPEAVMVINDEGKYLSLLRNELATKIMQEILIPGDFIAGNVLLLSTEGEEFISLKGRKDIILDIGTIHSQSTLPTGEN